MLAKNIMREKRPGKIVVFILLFAVSGTEGQYLNIGLFNDRNIQTLVVTPLQGEYQLVADGQQKQKCGAGSSFYVTMHHDSLKVISRKKLIGVFQTIHLIPLADTSVFAVKPVYPSLPKRIYDDGLYLKVQWKRIRIINHVEIDHYIAGVVQSEGGSHAHDEYYKTQAVLCRTYVIRNIAKHTDEGFNLCDGVHCQAYYNRGDKNPAIMEAAKATKNIIAVDSAGEPILAVFHSNCGGMTENSENVWPEVKSYLRSVNDPYCQKQKNSQWEKSIPLDKWKEYLKNNGFSLSYAYDPAYFNFTQYERKVYYRLGNDSLPLRKIRADWGLKSTFFSIRAEDGKLIFSGRGYGHGVGLCQEGAMQMARLGYRYEDILGFYYKNIRLVDFHAVNGYGTMFPAP